MPNVTKKYYRTKVEPHPRDHDRQTLSLIPSIVITNGPGNTIDACVHLIWYTDREEYSLWTFDHLTIVATNLEILTAVPPLIPTIAEIEPRTQPQDFERRLQKLGFRRL